MSLKCPICNNISKLEGRTIEVDLWRCPSCDHCFTDTNTIKEFEDYSSEYYEITHRSWFENPNIVLFQNISNFIKQNMPHASSLIDIGCGNGAFLRFLHKQNPKISLTGIDISSIEPAEGITFLKGDIFMTDFDKQYDIVVSIAVIEHIIDIHSFIKSIYALCNFGGFIIIMTINDRSILYKAAHLLYNLGYKAPYERLYSKHHLNHFNASSLRRLVEGHNLLVVKTLYHNAPLAAVDIKSFSPIILTIHRIGVYGTFILGSLTGRTYLQTIICQKSTEGS